MLRVQKRLRWALRHGGLQQNTWKVPTQIKQDCSHEAQHQLDCNASAQYHDVCTTNKGQLMLVRSLLRSCKMRIANSLLICRALGSNQATIKALKGRCLGRRCLGQAACLLTPPQHTWLRTHCCTPCYQHHTQAACCRDMHTPFGAL